VGTLLEQAPPSVAADPASYAQWLEGIRRRYGDWTGPLDRLGLLTVFQSLYFRGLLALLAVNIAACTLRRWRLGHRLSDGVRDRVLPANAGKAPQAAVPAPEAAERLRKSLARAHYRVTTDAAPGSVALFADKNRLSRFGTFFTHLSLVLILIGAVVGGIWGFEDPRFSVAEGSTRDVGLDTGLALRLDQFADEYHPDGTPKDFRADVTLLKHGEPVKTQAIRGTPLRYDGVASPVVLWPGCCDDGRDRGRHLCSATLHSLKRRGSPVFTLPARDITVHVIAPPPGSSDRLIRAGEVRVEVYQQGVRAAPAQNLAQGAPAELAGLTFTFERETRFLGLKVVKHPGLNIVWVACAFMVAGLVMLFYLPRRRLWVLCSEEPGGGSRVLVGMPAQRETCTPAEFNRLQARLARDLSAGTAELEGEPT
jgi:cytochrome c biogenesis protein